MPSGWAAIAVVGLSGFLIGCGDVDSAQGQNPTQNPTQDQGITQGQAPTQPPEQGTSSAEIPDGLYVMGGTSQGLEVSGDQYRYYSEGGEEEWQPVASLTLIQPG